MKKITMILLVSLLMITLFSGCQQEGKTEDTEETVNSGTEKKEGNSQETVEKSIELEGYLVSEDLVELSIHLHQDVIFKDSWDVFKKAEEMTNVKLTGTVPTSSSDKEQAFNTMLASGDLSDIISYYRLDDLKKYGMEGALLPLNDLIEEHAPNLSKFLDENPDVRKAITAGDGNIYAIGFVRDGEAAKGYYLRTDWLETLGLEEPKTVDEFYQVLKAFKEQDPNGNNKADEIPYFDRAKGNNTRALVALFGGHNSYYLDGNTIKYGPSDESYKIGMKNISSWYAEGLIDPEIFTRGGKARHILLGDNVGGATHDWFGSTAAFNNTLPETIDGFKFEPIAPPADINGKVWEPSVRVSAPDGNRSAWGIAITNPNPVETIKYFDFWWTVEGRRLMNFGVEGQQYDMVDGKPIFRDEILNGEESVYSTLQLIGAQIPIGFQQDFAYEEQWMNPIAKKGAKMYIDGGYCAKAMPPLTFTEEEQTILDEKQTAIRTLMEEATEKWILNAEDVNDGWDEYITTLEKLGINEVLDIYQKAYDRYIAQ